MKNTTKDSDAQSYGKAFKAYRKAAKLSQGEAAAALGISPRQVWNIEAGLATLPAEVEILTKEKAVQVLRSKAVAIPVEVVT